MITEERAKEICLAYYKTISDEELIECWGSPFIVWVNTWDKRAEVHKSYSDIFWLIEDYICEDFSGIGYKEVEEYLGEDNYDWFVHEFADRLKVRA